MANEGLERVLVRSRPLRKRLARLYLERNEPHEW